MIDAERLQDAITLLPEELLLPVDALRKQKRTFWKPIAAVAASFLLVAGLYQLQPAKKASSNGAFLEEDSAENVLTADRGDGYAGNSKEHSTSLYAYSLTAEVTEITEEHLAVTLSDGQSVKVYLGKIREHVDFSPGMEIILFFTQKPENLTQLYPESISIK